MITQLGVQHRWGSWVTGEALRMQFRLCNCCGRKEAGSPSGSMWHHRGPTSESRLGAARITDFIQTGRQQPLLRALQCASDPCPSPTSQQPHSYSSPALGTFFLFP